MNAVNPIEFGIVIPTYYRKDKKTKRYLKRCLKSIKKQTYTHYKVFLIGDNYEEPNELFEFGKMFPKEKIRIVNLPIAVERSKYSGEILWCTGGVNACNQGIKLMEEEGLLYYAHLDHDDYWASNHLKTISDMYYMFPHVDFIFTKSYFLNKYTQIPDKKIKLFINNLIPIEGEVAHSAISFKLNRIKHRYRNTWEELKIIKPGDADLINRVAEDVIQRRINCIYINIPTVYHLEEKINRNLFAKVKLLKAILWNYLYLKKKKLKKFFTD